MKRLVKDLETQVQKAIWNPFVYNDTWSEKTKDSFQTSSLEEVKTKLIEMNKGLDSFHVLNKTDKILATYEPKTFEQQIKFIEDFPKRYIGQSGWYRNNQRELIPATDVFLSLWPTHTKLNFE